MSQYIYAIIPYKSGIPYSKKNPNPCIFSPFIQPLKEIESEFAEQDVLSLFKDFLIINTCYRQSAFSGNRDGFCWIRAEIFRIAKALGASELWYVVETEAEVMEEPTFSFDSWVESMRDKNNSRVVELSTEILKGKTIYDVYHDDFSDIIITRPKKAMKR